MSDTFRPDDKQLVLVNINILPAVFGKVLEAKMLLQTGVASTATEAARMTGISRTAFYKYKDAIYPYDARHAGEVVTIHMVLHDRPGVLAGVLTAFARAQANILTVNQNIPDGETAAVSVSARIDLMQQPLEEFIRALGNTVGVERITRVSGGEAGGTV